MRKRIMTLAAAVLVLCGGAWAQDKMQDKDKMEKDKMMEQSRTLKGWVSDSACAAHGKKDCASMKHVEDGAKLVLVSEGDNKVWTITNPESLAKHQGKHVEVKASTNAEKETVTIKEVVAAKKK